MSLFTLTTAIDGSKLDNNFTDQIATIASNAQAGKVDYQKDLLNIPVLTSSTTLTDRTFDFPMADDAELVLLGVSIAAGAANCTVNATLSCPDGDKYLGTDSTLTVSATTHGAGTYVTTENTFTTSTGPKHFLMAGITYRLTVTNTTAIATTDCHAYVLLRSRRRRG